MHPGTLRYDGIADPPPAVPAIGEVRLPGRGVHPAVGTDHEYVELVGTSGYGCQVRAGCGQPAEQAPPAVPAVGEVGLPGSRVGVPISADHEDVELVGAA